MLELIFQGFFEWIYGLLVEIWEFIAEGLLDIMALDFAYLQSHIPVIDKMSQVLLAVGWALLLGNLVFQALKSMVAGLGFEGEDPKLLFSRTFVFAFLLLASPQICRIGLDLTSNIMALLRVPNATDVELVSDSAFGSLGAAWLLAILCSLIVMFKVLKLLVEIAERYVILAMLTITAPLAFAMGGSKNTASIFSGWCRMFGSMCLLMVTNLVCFKMLFSVVSTVPSGLDVFPWMVLIFAIVKVAHKSDAIITRIGLNPAITGGPGRTLPGMLAYTVVRTAVSQVAKGVGNGGSGGKSAKASAAGPKAGSGSPSGSTWSRFSSPNYGGRSASQQNSSSHSSTQRGGAQQTSSQQSSASHGTAQQTNTRQENMSHSATQQSTGGSTTVNSSSRTSQSSPRGAQGRQTRRSSVPPGTRRSPSHVPPTGSTAQAPGTSNPQTTQGQPGASAPKQPNSPRPGAAGTAVSKGGAFDAAKSHPGAAGTPARNTTPKQPNAPRPGSSGTSPKGRASRQSNHVTQTGTVGKGGTARAPGSSTKTNNIQPGPAGSPSKGTPPKQPKGAQPGQAGTGTHAQSTRSTHMASQVIGGSTVNNSTQTNAVPGKGSTGTTAPRQPHPGGPAVSTPSPKPGKARSTKRENTGEAPKTPPAPSAPAAPQPGSAGKPSRSTQRPSDSAPRPGRNVPPATSAPPTGGTSSSTVRQEHTSSSSRTTVNNISSNPARQEPRKPAAPASPSMKGGAPNVRPGPAGTAQTSKQAASTKRPVAHSPKRANPVRRPPPRNQGGPGHG